MQTPVWIPVPGAAQAFVPGLVSKLSQTGMELYAGVNLQPGEMMQVEFRAPHRTIHIAGIVRSRSGFCYGLEFCATPIEVGQASMTLP